MDIKKHLNLKCYKAIGFYLSAASALFALIAGIIYGAGFQKETLSSYYSPAPVALLIVGVVVYAVLVLFKESARYAPKALWAFTLLGLFTFVGTAYMYLSGIFYNGVTGEALAMIDGAFMGSIVLMLISCIVCNVALWMRQTPDDNAEANTTTVENIESEVQNEENV